MQVMGQSGRRTFQGEKIPTKRPFRGGEWPCELHEGQYSLRGMINSRLTENEYEDMDIETEGHDTRFGFSPLTMAITQKIMTGNCFLFKQQNQRQVSIGDRLIS